MAEKKINGRTFKVTPMLASEALAMQARLFKAIGPAMPRLPAILAGLKEDRPAEARTAAEVSSISALVEILGGAQPGETTALVKDICEKAMIQRQGGNFEDVDLDHDFTGHLADIPAVVLFVLKENFSDFFGDVLKSVGNRARAAS
ncbi:hypothetical protein SAMN02745157_2528 [Kaistia soli DSM 19436]|uniref:Uncharacterized protein n=1 Tax=Kaistia soli DSM 19436 TaxID=1122133 RepID=A0A1M5D1E4_9HYPH|nr:hypothetical protein [Kaistia soli]SHF60700.1 hypothetical protein SAMN02745157_2528 [Kaistia soli DSM 19436]